MKNKTLVVIFTCDECYHHREVYVNNEFIFRVSTSIDNIKRIEGFIEGLQWAGHDIEMHNVWNLCEGCLEKEGENE